MTRPDERRFVLFRRGHVRDQIILAHMRNSLRSLVNPDTGEVFTEDEIERITQEGSRYYIKADAIDLYGQAAQARSSYFVDQIIPTRAATPFLHNVHGRLWLPEGKLSASGGSGSVLARAQAGTIWVGSTTVPSAGAVIGRDPNGRRYQVLTTSVTAANGEVELTIQAIDGGDETNIAEDTTITWVNPPVGGEPEASATEDFSGGLDEETDADYAARIEDRIRHRPASGNQAHFRAWARQASNSVETAFVYACALNAGSVVVCITQKRSNSVGATARIPNLATLTAVKSYLTPPNSPVVPGNAQVLVVPPVPEACDISMRFGLRRGTSGGWNDVNPWPRTSDTYPLVEIVAVASQTEFTIETDEAPVFTLPATGLNVPTLMVWNDEDCEFEQLFVSSVTSIGSDQYTIELSQEASFILAVGDVISPYTDRADSLAQAAQDYFDNLGPGELLDLQDDPRGHRAFRFPIPAESNPQRVGQSITTAMLDQLGGAAAEAELVYASETTPAIPSNITDGPNMLVLGSFGIYDIE